MCNILFQGKKEIYSIIVKLLGKLFKKEFSKKLYIPQENEENSFTLQNGEGNSMFLFLGPDRKIFYEKL